MSYCEKGEPQIGDRVRHLSGKIGTVTYIEPKQGNTAGRYLAVRFDDGSLPAGMLPAARFTLISRTIPCRTEARPQESRGGGHGSGVGRGFSRGQSGRET